MQTPLTFWDYISRKFFYYFFLVLFIFLSIIFFLDTLEILKRSFLKELSFNELIKIVIYKLPYLMQICFPFGILIGSILTLFNLNRNHELMVARSFGLSAWVFLFPILASAFIIGVISTTVINPFVAITIQKHDILEKKYLRNKDNVLNILDVGIWLKDLKNDKTEKIIYAKNIYDRGKYLSQVSIFIAGENDEFVKRINADFANIDDHSIKLNQVKIFEPGKLVINKDVYILSTNVSFNQLQKNLINPEIISFWDLPKFINKLEKSGFSSLEHKFHFYNLFLTPFFFVALVIISATFSLSMPRRGKLGFMVFITILIGFGIYLLNKITYTLILSGSINLIIGVIAPILICFFLGSFLLFHYEDG